MDFFFRFPHDFDKENKKRTFVKFISVNKGVTIFLV